MRHEAKIRTVLLLIAALLRLWAITSAPPGLTHDEADHGLSAWQVVQGERPLYFTVGYGREPLFDYATAGLMTVLGPSFLAGRLTAVFFSLLLLAATYALIKKRFSPAIALLTLAGLTVGFWPLMVARQALRTITFPFFFVLALFFWLRGAEREGHRGQGAGFRWFLLAGLLLGLTFYTYFPARLMWLLFPALLAWWGLRRRDLARRLWRPVLLVLLAAGVVSTPLWLYLWRNPGAEQRLVQLTDPLEAARGGDFRPLAANVMDGIRLIPYQGDPAWRYNLPGRPLLSPFFALLFGVGFLLVLRGGDPVQSGRSASLASANPELLICWLLLGLAPVFVTGAFLANTRAIALQPILYVFPAVALSWMWSKADGRSPFALSAVLILFAFTGLDTVQRYFLDWAGHPEVRVQYEAAAVRAITYLNEHGGGAAAISTTTPGRFHNQPVGLLTSTNPQTAVSWFNGQRALYVPADPDALLIETGFAPLAPALAAFAAGRQPLAVIEQPATDLDRPLTVSTLDGQRWQRQVWGGFAGSEREAVWEIGLEFGGARVEPAVPRSGETLEVFTLWRPGGPVDADLVFFSQLLGGDGLPLAQEDRLDAPAASWRAGDAFIQWHRLAIPAGAAPGDYPLIIGVYREDTGRRYAVAAGGRPVGDFLEIGQITIGE